MNREQFEQSLYNFNLTADQVRCVLALVAEGIDATVEPTAFRLRSAGLQLDFLNRDGTPSHEVENGEVVLSDNWVLKIDGVNSAHVIGVTIPPLTYSDPKAFAVDLVLLPFIPDLWFRKSPEPAPDTSGSTVDLTRGVTVHARTDD